MVARRKNSTRTGWDSVVARLARKTASGGKASESGERHPGSVGKGKPGAKRSLASGLEEMLDEQIRYCVRMPYQREYKFHPDRKWRFDFCWPELKIAVEVEGGVWSGGRHTTGSGFTKDCEKYNHAALLGYRVLRFTGDMIKSGDSILMIKEMISGRDQSK
jgi:very-short-patch-repair endonuclease